MKRRVWLLVMINDSKRINELRGASSGFRSPVLIDGPFVCWQHATLFLMGCRLCVCLCLCGAVPHRRGHDRMGKEGEWARGEGACGPTHPAGAGGSGACHRTQQVRTLLTWTGPKPHCRGRRGKDEALCLRVLGFHNPVSFTTVQISPPPRFLFTTHQYVISLHIASDSSENSVGLGENWCEGLNITPCVLLSAVFRSLPSLVF